MSYEQSGYIPSPQPGAVPPPPDGTMTGAMPGVPMPGMPYQQQPQPGVWPGQPVMGYAPAPVYAPPPPSLINTPSVLVDKLPMVAMIGFIGFAAAGLFDLIGSIWLGAGPYAATGPYILTGLGQFIEFGALGVVWFAVLMALKHIADQNAAKEAPAA